MALQSSFDLAQSLSEDERNTLLKKISDSLEVKNHNNDSQDLEKTVFKGDEEQAREIKKFLSTLNIFDRIVFHFKGFFLGKEKSDLMRDFQLKALNKDISENSVELYQHESGLLSRSFFDLIHRLKKHIEPIQEFCDPLWNDEQCLPALVEFLIEKKIPNAKFSIFEFIELSEIREIDQKHESIHKIKEILVQRIASYIKSIPNEVFEDIEQGIIPIYVLRNLLHFDFDSLPLFNNSTNAKPASSFIVRAKMYLTDIEKLLKVLDNTQNKQAQYPIADEFFIFMLNYKKENPPENTNEELLLWKRNFLEIKKEISFFLQKSKIQSIVQVIKSNPNFRVKNRVTQLNIPEFYQSSLELKILEELYVEYIELRKDLVMKLRKSLFETESCEFDHYRRFSSVTRTAITPFMYVNCLWDIYQYLKQNIKVKHEKKLKGISRHYILKDRNIYSNLLGILSHLSIVFKDIVAFDGEFSPVSPEGRDFYNRREKVEQDASQVFNYEVYVHNKNGKAKEILERGTKQLSILQEITSHMLSIESSLDENKKLGVEVQDYLKDLVLELEHIQKLIFSDKQLEEEALDKLL